MVTPVCFHGSFALSLTGLFCPRAWVLLVASASGASLASNVSLEVWLCHPCFLWEGTRAHPQKGMGSWVLLALESCGLKQVCNCLPATKESVWTLAEPAKFTSTLGCGKTVEGKSSSRLALAPALENKCSQRGLWVCTAALHPEICLHSSYPVLQFFLSCVHSRGARYAQWRFSSSVSPSETCLYVMPLTYVVVLAPIMWWISLG